MNVRTTGIAAVLSLAACASSTGPARGSSSGTSNTKTDGGIAGQALFERMAGLWSGQAAQTPLGSFPEMAMDFRAADDHWLFGRTDLDAQNNLRYGFAVEDIGGEQVLVYRNGGYFQGMLRDLTTTLQDFDDDAGVYHFCAQPNSCLYVNGSCIPETGGCSFVDAVFTFSSPTQLVFNAHVNGQEHLIWTATREETRTLPDPFPTNPSPLAADAGWPAMPQLSADVTWSTPLDAGANVWVILSDTPCATVGSTAVTCSPSRTLLAYADAGSTSASLLFDQIHSGSYDTVAVLDLAGGFGTVTQSLEPGDGVSNPSASMTIPASGQGSSTMPILFYLP